MYPLDSKRILYFVTVANEKSFTRAAKKLAIAQPPLSQQVKLLEEEIGFKLFERAKRKEPVLTPEGRVFYQEALKVLDGLKNLRVKAKEQSQGFSGNIRVGYIPSFSSYKFAKMLREFKNAHPGIIITLVEKSTVDQLSAFSDEAIDVGFSRNSKIFSNNFVKKSVQVQEMKLAVPAGHPFEGRKSVKWAELYDENLILIDSKLVSTDFYADFFQKFEDGSLQPSVSHYTIGIINQIWLVSAGMGVAPIPVAGKIKVEGVRWIDLPRDRPTYDINLVWRENNSSPLIEQFIQFSLEFWK